MEVILGIGQMQVHKMKKEKKPVQLSSTVEGKC